jgi:hypothetical protein
MPSTVESVIESLEERLRVAELGPDPAVFQELLADDVVLMSEEGVSLGKSRVVEAHQPGAGPKFTRVEMRDYQIIDHDDAVVVTCSGTYEMPDKSFTLKFMRVWAKKNGHWQIIAGSVTH